MNQVNLLVISSDARLFDQTSAAFNHQQAYAQHFSHTTILVLNTRRKTSDLGLITDTLDIIPVDAINNVFLIPQAIHCAIQLHRNRPFELITAEDPLQTGYIGKKLKEKFHIPLNIQVHTDTISNVWRQKSWQNRLMFQVVKSNLQAADSIRVISESLKQSLTSIFVPRTSYPSPLIFIAPTEIDLSLFYKPAHYRPLGTRLVSMGNLVPQQNYSLLIDAFAQITKKFPDAKLTIIGDGPDKEQLASQIINFGLNDKIFLVGNKTTSEIAAALHRHDIYIQPGYDCLGLLPYIWAYAAGLPIIAAPVASAGELLKPNQNCLIATDHSSLAAGIELLIQHPEEAYRLGKNSQMWIKQNLESQILVKQWVDELVYTLGT